MLSTSGAVLVLAFFMAVTCISTVIIFVAIVYALRNTTHETDEERPIGAYGYNPLDEAPWSAK